MKIAIHQPNYLPYIGFFQKMALSDVFVLLDTVQFSKDSYTQRTKIRTKQGTFWQTIPVSKSSHFKRISDILLPDNSEWLANHCVNLITNYKKSRFFDPNIITECYPEGCCSLSDFNEVGISYLKEKFRIKTKLILASELEIDPKLKSTDLLIEIVKEVGGDEYISGMGAKNYQDEQLFEKTGIGLEYFKFQPLEYDQRWKDFIPYLSAVDLLFNLGDEDSSKFFVRNSIGVFET